MGDPYLRLNEGALNWDPAEVTVPPVPAIPPGADPMSVMLAAITPQISEAVTKGVIEALAREERFSANVTGARSAYQTTDGAAQQQIQSAGGMTEPAGAAGGVGSAGAAGSPASQAGQLGQMMGMPMQMASQAAQIPMQLAGMAASIPQGIMQGVQSAMQQVGQMAGGAGEETDPESDGTGRRVAGRGEARRSRQRETRGEAPFGWCRRADQCGTGTGATANAVTGCAAAAAQTRANAPGDVRAGKRSVTCAFVTRRYVDERAPAAQSMGPAAADGWSAGGRAAMGTSAWRPAGWHSAVGPAARLGCSAGTAAPSWRQGQVDLRRDRGACGDCSDGCHHGVGGRQGFGWRIA